MATAPKAPVWSSFFGGADVPNYGLSNFTYMLSQSDLPQNQAKINEVVSKVGSIDKYLQGIKNYEAAYQDYLLEHAKYVSKDYYGQELPQDRVDFYTQQKEDVVAQAQKQLDAAKQTQIDAAQESRNLRDARFTNLRNELETQYNNLVGLDSRFGYAGRNSDLPTVFNQQAAQLADAGVMSIADLRIQDGRLYDAANRRVVTNSNLGGQVYTDRDTGVQKWGDIFTGVKGGANYGIMEAPDGSVLLFPAWEKTKSPIAQVGLGGLESVITPLLTVGGAFIGAGPAGSVAGAALGAGAGSTVGQLLASGEVDWENVAKSAATAGAGAYVGGLLGGGEAAAADLTGTTTGGMLGPDAGFQVATGGQLASTADLANAAFIAEDAAQLYQQTGNIAAVQQNLIGAGVDPIIAAEAANLSSLGLNAAQIASNLSPSMIGEIYGPSAGTLRIEDLAFVGDDAAQLWGQTGDVAAVQQNLIAAGVDPIMAAEASNLAALGQSGSTITSNLNQAFPGETVFTSEGLLSGGSTMDDFAKKIGGDISSSATPAIGVKEALDAARLGSQLLSPQQQMVQQGGLLGGVSGVNQPMGVDFSPLYGQTMVGLLPLAEQYRRSLL